MVGSGEREEQREGLENRCLGAGSSQVSQAANLHLWNLYCQWPIVYMGFIFHFLLKEVDRYLRHSDFLDLKRTELLYKKYLEDVSEPFMQKIKDQMDSQSREEVQKRLQEQFSQYLNYSTKKVSMRSTFLSWRGLYTEDCGQDQGLSCYFLSVDNLEFRCTLPVTYFSQGLV